MAFTVNLYTFTKESNSTKQPNGSGTQFSCNVLTPADITAPIIELSATDLTAYNYAYISAFHRYYWVEDISWNDGIWRLTLACDVLATYKSAIGAESLYVLRSSAAYDGDIRDNYYPMTADVTKHRQQAPLSSIPGYQLVGGNYQNLGFDGGYIVLNVAGTGTLGATTLILLTVWDFKRLVAALYTAIDGFQFSDVIKSVVQKFGGNPQQLINSAMWVPWAFNGDDYDQVTIGSWKAQDYSNPDAPTTPQPIYGLYIDDPIYTTASYNYSLYKHPQASSRGAYLNLSPFTNYSLGIPGCGVVNLDSSKLIGESSITVIYRIDAFTGQMLAEVYATSSNLKIAWLTGQVGIPISLRGSNGVDNVISGLGGAAAATAAAVTTGGATAIIGAATAGIGAALDTVQGTPVSSNIGAGAASIIGVRGWLDTIHYNITDGDNIHNGRPLMAMRTPSAIGGYIMVQKGDVPISGTSAEAARIKAFLEGGFYYE